VSLEFSWTNSGDGTDFQHYQDTLHKIVVFQATYAIFRQLIPLVFLIN